MYVSLPLDNGFYSGLYTRMFGTINVLVLIKTDLLKISKIISELSCYVCWIKMDRSGGQGARPQIKPGNKSGEAKYFFSKMAYQD